MRHPDLSDYPGSAATRVLSVTVLAVPAAVLGVAAARYDSSLLAAGAVAELLGALLFARSRAAWRPPASGSVILLYLMALGWLWFATRDHPDAFARAGRGLFVLAAVGLTLGHDLIRTGLEPRRRARQLCRRLTARTKWPVDPGEYAALPEVRALADAVWDDPGPALPLFDHYKPEVRTAVFVALRGRKHWRPGEAAAVVHAAQAASEPVVRAAAVGALGGADEPAVVEAVAKFLRDPVAAVRRAAVEVLLAGGGDRWPTVRDLIRDALADPLLAADGPLPGAAGRLSAMAVCDLTAWAAEPEPLAGRAVRTLVGHYAAGLRAGGPPELPAELGRQVTDAQTPTLLRAELAGLLRGLGLLPPDLLDRMTDADQPSPVRLLAAETILGLDPGNPDAVDVLRGLGRQSNRETVLAIARLLQMHLGLDMGLPANSVPANSKAANEAARRVLRWAVGRAATPPPASGYAPPARPAPPRVLAPTVDLKKTDVVSRPNLAFGDDDSSGNIWAPK